MLKDQFRKKKDCTEDKKDQKADSEEKEDYTDDKKNQKSELERNKEDKPKLVEKIENTPCIAVSKF